MKYVYIISFLTFGTNEYQTYLDGYKTRRDAEMVVRQRETKQLNRLRNASKKRNLKPNS